MKALMNSIKDWWKARRDKTSELDLLLIAGPMDFYELHHIMKDVEHIYHPTWPFANVESTNMKRTFEQYFQTILSGWDIVNGYGIFIPSKEIWAFGVDEELAKIRARELLSDKIVTIKQYV